MLLIKDCVYALYIYTLLEKYYYQPDGDGDRYCDLLMGSREVTRAGNVKTMGDFSCIHVDQVCDSIRAGNAGASVEIGIVLISRLRVQMLSELASRSSSSRNPREGGWLWTRFRAVHRAWVIM